MQIPDRHFITPNNYVLDPDVVTWLIENSPGYHFEFFVDRDGKNQANVMFPTPEAAAKFKVFWI